MQNQRSVDEIVAIAGGILEISGFSVEQGKMRFLVEILLRRYGARDDEIIGASESFAHRRENRKSVDIAMFLERIPRLHYPDADSMWSMMHAWHVKGVSAVVVDEAVEAFREVEHALDVGSEVGARMAFKGLYESSVNRALGQGEIVPRWRFLKGDDGKAYQRTLLLRYVKDGFFDRDILTKHGLASDDGAESGPSGTDVIGLPTHTAGLLESLRDDDDELIDIKALLKEHIQKKAHTGVH